MKVLFIITGILMFAAATIILYIWGLKKASSEKKDLMSGLFSKGEKKVIKALREKPRSYSELKKILAGTKTRLFYSRQTAQVQDADKFTKSLLDAMVDKHIIVEKFKEQHHYYMLP